MLTKQQKLFVLSGILEAKDQLFGAPDGKKTSFTKMEAWKAILNDAKGLGAEIRDVKELRDVIWSNLKRCTTARVAKARSPGVDRAAVKFSELDSLVIAILGEEAVNEAAKRAIERESRSGGKDDSSSSPSTIRISEESHIIPKVELRDDLEEDDYTEFGGRREESEPMDTSLAELLGEVRKRKVTCEEVNRPKRDKRSNEEDFSDGGGGAFDEMLCERLRGETTDAELLQLRKKNIKLANMKSRLEIMRLQAETNADKDELFVLKRMGIKLNNFKAKLEIMRLQGQDVSRIQPQDPEILEFLTKH